MAGFGDDLIDGEGGAEDGVVAREAAVLAVVDALVGDVEGGKEAHGAAEVAPGDGARLADHGLELGGGLGIEESGEALHQRGLAAGKGVERRDEAGLEIGHDGGRLAREPDGISRGN